MASGICATGCKPSNTSDHGTDAGGIEATITNEANSTRRTASRVLGDHRIGVADLVVYSSPGVLPRS
jgi:hypothetical protein